MVLFHSVFGLLPPLLQEFISIFDLFSLLRCIFLILSPPLSFICLSLLFIVQPFQLFSLFPLLSFLFLGSSFSFPLISAIAANSYIWNRVGTSYSCDFTLK